MRIPGMTSGPVVETASGRVRGKLRGKGTIAMHAGIPYAAPPVGDLRWRPPQPPQTWSKIRDCTKPGPAGFQRAVGYEQFFDALAKGLGLSTARQRALETAVKVVRSNQSEDCLTLNVRAPAEAQGLPVMVWIHGGDHTDGHGGDPIYHSSDSLPKRGCVLVTINYRLGLFGFLAHPELTNESEHSTSGNYGLLDQIAALEWVRDNIESFGGDPNRVTIFGESAGGQAVLNLMTAPAARGLFHGAIAQSPSDSGRWLHLRRPVLDFTSAEAAGERFAEAAVGGHDGQLRRLRGCEAETLYALYRERTDLGRYFYPVVDRYHLPTTPMSAFSLQNQAPVPLMIGYNADEGSLLVPFSHPAGAEFSPITDGAGPAPSTDGAASISEILRLSYGSQEEAARLLELYPGLDAGNATAAANHLGDHMFGVHVDHASRQHAAGGHPVWRYHYRAVPPSPKQTAGAFHAAELTNVFDSSIPLLPVASDNHLLSRAMGDRWFAFAAQHRPDFPGLESWPTYDPANPKHMVFNRPRSGIEACPAEPGLDLMRARIDRLTAETVATAGH